MKYMLMTSMVDSPILNNYELKLEEYKSSMLTVGVIREEFIEVHAFDDQKGETLDDSIIIKEFYITGISPNLRWAEKTSTSKKA